MSVVVLAELPEIALSDPNAFRGITVVMIVCDTEEEMSDFVSGGVCLVQQGMRLWNTSEQRYPIGRSILIKAHNQDNDCMILLSSRHVHVAYLPQHNGYVGDIHAGSKVQRWAISVIFGFRRKSVGNVSSEEESQGKGMKCVRFRLLCISRFDI